MSSSPPTQTQTTFLTDFYQYPIDHPFILAIKMTFRKTLRMTLRMTFRMALKTGDFKVVSKEDFEGYFQYFHEGL